MVEPEYIDPYGDDSGYTPEACPVPINGVNGVGILSIVKTDNTHMKVTLTNNAEYVIELPVGTGEKGDKGDTGEKGDTGNTGADGTDGTNGIDGVDGTDGINGTNGTNGINGINVRSGAGIPSDGLGANGDAFIDYITGNYYVRNLGVYTLQGNIMGPEGPEGTPGLNFTGTFIDGDTYNNKDVIEFNGSSFVCNTDGTTDSPDEDPTRWDLLASKGDIGPAGPSGGGITTLTGDVTASGTGTVASTLATVNGNVGTFGTASKVARLTVNAKGLTTAASEVDIQISESQVTNLNTDLTSINTNLGSINTSITSINTALGERITTNTNQTGLTGDKSTSGFWSFLNKIAVAWNSSGISLAGLGNAAGKLLVGNNRSGSLGEVNFWSIIGSAPSAKGGFRFINLSNDGTTETEMLTLNGNDNLVTAHGKLLSTDVNNSIAIDNDFVQIDQTDGHFVRRTKAQVISDLDITGEPGPEGPPGADGRSAATYSSSTDPSLVTTVYQGDIWILVS